VNNGIPTAVLQSAVKLTKDQTNQLKASWREAMATRGILPVILSGGLTYSPLNLKPSDVGLLDLRTFDEQRIAAAFGVPLWLVGLPMKDGLTYSTVSGTFDFFWRATLRAAAFNMTQALSEWALGPNQWLHVDDESYTRGNLLERSQAYQILVGIGALSPQEVRIAENFAPQPPSADPGSTDLDLLANVTDGGV
jgi:HK97 family phage portal protein